MHRGGHDDLQQQTGEQQKEVLLEEKKFGFVGSRYISI